MTAYQEWVSRIVMPIAFAWIAEHDDEVYANVPKEPDLRDDVGVVIAAAFELVSKTDVYLEGVKKSQEYEDAKRKGKLETATLNPIWTKITKEVGKATH